MFANLTERFQNVFNSLSGRGKLREEHVRTAARDIRLALLAADVHVSVVKDFVDVVAERAVGQNVLDSITPHQQFIKIVSDELTRVLGGETIPFDFAATPPLVVMIVGLQGGGKTTSAAKFASFCRSQGRRPLLVPADVHRPAAIEQLTHLANEEKIACFSSKAGDKAVSIAKNAVKHAKAEGYDTVIIDTAGRLHIDEEMMAEARAIAKEARPQRILYVADAMTGQDAARSAAAFNDALPITGVVLTKCDGDARGGAALSIRAVTGQPLLFVGVGERTDEFEEFHPDRMARRVLGMGDVVSFVETVEQKVSSDEMEEMAENLKSGQFTLEDYRSQLNMMRRMGPAEKLLGLIPGFSAMSGAIDGQEMKATLKRRRAILDSMTSQERKNPTIINGSRRKRMAMGSGTEVTEVNRLLKEFKTMSQMMRKVRKGGMKKLLRGLTGGGFSC